MPDDHIDYEPSLRGTTLRVYWFMLQKGGPAGVREVQRALGLSSPSVASHHLTKLERLELVSKNSNNEYELTRVVKVGVLREFIRFRGIVLPRYFFLAVFFTVFLVVYLIVTWGSYPTYFDRAAVVVLGVAGAVLTWFETYRLLRLKFA